MCSILGVFDLRPGADLGPLRPLALSLSARQRHRGPDWSGVHVEPNALLVHERLAIVDPSGGAQPLHSEDGDLTLAVNGEIYNHRALEGALRKPYAFQSGSDCEVINALYAESRTREGSHIGIACGGRDHQLKGSIDGRRSQVMTIHAAEDHRS